MEEKTTTCVGCSNACELMVGMEKGTLISVNGNSCPRGEAYAFEKMVSMSGRIHTKPRIKDCPERKLKVMTETDVPKEKFKSILLRLRALEVQTPIEIGDVVCENIAGTGVNVIAVEKA
ncbi:MAG: DUF1667 domain-containing protein [Hespellia sp.]|nr:DUF1667 domain-containing protein [Hespellia sp.]